jgi:hypothetical protein
MREEVKEVEWDYVLKANGYLPLDSPTYGIVIARTPLCAAERVVRELYESQNTIDDKYIVLYCVPFIVEVVNTYVGKKFLFEVDIDETVSFTTIGKNKY